MPWKASVLVVANVTATSPELLAALSARSARGPVDFTLVMPSRGAGATAREQTEQALGAALERLRTQGLAVEGVIGDPDPFVAVLDVFDPRRFDEIVVATLPARSSHWLRIDLGQRLERATGLPVTHVEASLPKAQPTVHVVPRHPSQGVLEPLRVLAWGGPRRSSTTTGRRSRTPE
jgi:GABA permease